LISYRGEKDHNPGGLEERDDQRGQDEINARRQDGKVRKFPEKKDLPGGGEEGTEFLIVAFVIV